MPGIKEGVGGNKKASHPVRGFNLANGYFIKEFITINFFHAMTYPK
jgi:hypothetical protein